MIPGKIEMISEDELDARLIGEGRFGVLRVTMHTGPDEPPSVGATFVDTPGMKEFMVWWGEGALDRLITDVLSGLTDAENSAISAFHAASHLIGLRQEIFRVQFNFGPGPEGWSGPVQWDYYVLGPGVVVPLVKGVAVKIGDAILQPLINAFDDFEAQAGGGA